VWLGLPEGRWQPVELEQSLVGLIRKFQPLIIYAPSRIDFHPEHLNVAGALSRALALVEAEIRDRIHVRVFQVQVPLGSVLANRVIDISGVVETADAALQEYRSQRGSIEFVYRRRDYDARARGMRGPVEAFWEISARQYIAVHAGDTAGWQGKFRGFRRFAWTDPLAYLQGQGERRRLRILADRFA
jgi:LmbE family N-acetylglucosaminyl deacetylase